MSNPYDVIPMDETNDEYIARCEHDADAALNGVDGYTDFSIYDYLADWES